MIFIQSDNSSEYPHHFDAACALYGAMECGEKFKLIKYSDVSEGKMDLLIRNSLFVGSVEFMREVFGRLGLSPRVPINSNREPKIMTLGEVREIVSGGVNLFIKPVDIKLFTGFVLDRMVYSSIQNIPDNTMVMVYEPFKSPIESEWRCYIRDGEIVDIRNYSGDMWKIPKKSYVEGVLNEYKSKFPVCFTIDVGVLENGENVVVEFNDMWAIGNYGLDNMLYLSLLKRRYFEIVRRVDV